MTCALDIPVFRFSAIVSGGPPPSSSVLATLLASLEQESVDMFAHFLDRVASQIGSRQYWWEVFVKKIVPILLPKWSQRMGQASAASGSLSYD